MAYGNTCNTDRENLRLEVLIATIGREGIGRVASMALPRVEGVRYLVSWQMAGETIPESLKRPDVRIVPSASTGLSNNRNDAFEASMAPLLLIADDDLRYTAEGLVSVIETMDGHSDVDIAAFMHTGGDGKSFPDFEFDLAMRVKNYYVTSFEIAVRRHVVTGDRGVRFDPRFGIGAPKFKAGEEQFFVDDVLRAGFKGRFFPVTIVTHPGCTTSYRYLTPGVLEAQGVYLRSQYPWYISWARIPLIAWRHCRARRCRLLPAMWSLLKGWTQPRHVCR